jgi:hypothetical protein
MERHLWDGRGPYGHTDALGLGDYGDDIDEYPEHGDQANVNGNEDPSRWGPETCAL